MRWLSIIGIGEDGVEGLPKKALAALSAAKAVYGGKRHLELAAAAISGEVFAWPSPIESAFQDILRRKGDAVAVLASGDPFHYGIGSVLAEHVPPSEMVAYPQPSSLSLAAARLGWGLQDCVVVSLHGRPLEDVLRHLTHEARILALAWDGSTAGRLAELLVRLGHGDAMLHRLEALGGPQEAHHQATARESCAIETAALTVLAIEMPRSGGTIWPLTPGLDDERFESDGQLTKQHVRAVTLSRLAPQPGQLLWDIGGGSGSIGIEWMLRHPSNRAISVERDGGRAERIQRNAAALGAVRLQVCYGAAPQALAALPEPDAVFIGGGTSEPGLIRAALAALKPGGRLVANAVTVEGEQALLAASKAWGGEVHRIGIDRLDSVGPYRAWRSAMAVVQWVVTKDGT
jgi:precorrin-6B C5,15-methyltransferase / cobalt-precorrin-6B C5,C15-methyltransferase